MTQKQRAHLEKRLLQERERALRVLAQFDERAKNPGGTNEDGDITNYPLHLADEGTDTMEQEKEFLLASQEGRRVYEIDEALRRLYRDPKTFGRCENCGRPISVDRLDIVPWARLCADCQRSAEGAEVAA
jgi:RNA polymerase-binding transcription factor DksA